MLCFVVGGIVLAGLSLGPAGSISCRNLLLDALWWLEHNTNFRTCLALALIPSSKSGGLRIIFLGLCFFHASCNSTQLRRLLDVASAHEPAWSEERAGVAKPVRVSPRQLGGVGLVRLSTVRITRVEVEVLRAGQNCSGQAVE